MATSKKPAKPAAVPVDAHKHPTDTRVRYPLRPCQLAGFPRIRGCASVPNGLVFGLVFGFVFAPCRANRSEEIPGDRGAVPGA